MKQYILMASILALSFSVTAPVFAGHHGEGKKSKHWQEIDTNSDGVVSKDEFLSNAGKKFDAMDFDGNGSLSKEEKGAHYKKMKEKRQEMHEKIKEKRQSSSE